MYRLVKPSYLDLSWEKWDAEHEGHTRDRVAPIAELESMTMAHHLDSDSPKITAMAEDMKRHGVREPIQVEHTNKGPFVSDGHHRLLAAKRAGLTHVPIREYANTPEGRRAANKAMIGK